MEEIITTLLIILIIYLVYKYQLYINSKKVKSCNIIYKVE